MFRKTDKDAPAKTSDKPSAKVTASGAATAARTAAEAGVSKGRTAAEATLSKGKQAYEARRAAKAGMGLEKWMAEKERRVEAERTALQRARAKAEPRKPGLLRRLLDRAHKPI